MAECSVPSPTVSLVLPAMLKAGTLFDLVRQGKIPRNLSKPAADRDMHDKSSSARNLLNILKYNDK